MKKNLAIILALTAFSLCLVSCNWFGGGEDDQTVNGDFIWSSKFDSVIVAEENTKDTEELKFHLYTLTKKACEVISPDEPVRSHEIVFGDVGRTISDEAYSRLDRRADLLALKTLEQSAYLIYANEGSLAIAYSDIYARALAIDYIVENLKSTDYSYDGIVAYEISDTADIVDNFREKAISDAV